MATHDSPLLGDADLRAILRLTPAQIKQTLQALIAEGESITTQVVRADTPISWTTIVVPHEDVHDRLSQSWGRIEHLHNVMDALKWRQVMRFGSDLMVTYWTRFDQNQRLFQKYSELRTSPEYRTLSAAQQRVVNLQLRDFRLAGADLPAGKKRQLATLNTTLSLLSKEFSNRVLDATNAVMIDTTDPKDIVGIPDSVVALAAQRARRARIPGWRFTLQGAEPSTIVRTSFHQPFRKRVYQAMSRNASELGPTKYDTTPIIAKILKQRQLMARLLGFRTFAAYSLSRKMVGRPERAIRFVRGMATVARRQAERDQQSLARFAARKLGISRLQPWDAAYVADQLRAKKFGYTQDQLRRYFPHRAVLATLEDTVWRVLHVRLKRAKNFHGYHPDVFRYDVYDARRVLLGSIIVDLFSRPTKRAGAWAGEDTSRRLIHGHMRPPIANCTLNCVPPDATGVAWMTHDDMHTLFHEFGHVLNHILSTVTEPRVGGTAGVEWDAVELPSQWMERFTWEPTVVSEVSRHGARLLPTAARQQIMAANSFLSGLYVLRQARFGLFDLTLHTKKNPRLNTALQVWRATARAYDVVPLPADNRFPNNFHHIFDGGYAAGYYSYLWAEVMAADAFAPLKHRSRRWRIDGQRFRREILAAGGSRPAQQSFRAYRGRLPNPRPLMADYGLRRA